MEDKYIIVYSAPGNTSDLFLKNKKGELTSDISQALIFIDEVEAESFVDDSFNKGIEGAEFWADVKRSLYEDATQASAVDGGRIDVFGSKRDKDLFNLTENLSIKDLQVKSYTTEDTGGHTMVVMGQLQNGKYFGLSDELLVLFDEDYHQAYLAGMTEDTDWIAENYTDEFDSDSDEYKYVYNQVQ